MNIIALDIGNNRVKLGLFIDGVERYIKGIPCGSMAALSQALRSAWDEVPLAKASRSGKRDGVIVASSVNPEAIASCRTIIREELAEKLNVIGGNIPLPMPLWVDEPKTVGTDRVVAAAAAYDVVQDAVAVADFGTAVTIDLVDQKGIFLGGVIFPGFGLCSASLTSGTGQLPGVTVERPSGPPFGRNTIEAINCGLYYSAVGTLQEVLNRYAEKLGRWPHAVVTGGFSELIRPDCLFVDSFVPDLVVKGIVLAYRKHLESRA